MGIPVLNNDARLDRESGYSLLMVIFMVATMLILAATAMPNLLTQGRREREIDTIWRGQQYERAIGLYFRKFGRYPTKIEDLTKQTNGVRFLRQAYTDPMNKEDGSWRFIYVGPNGQLIGSVRNTTLNVITNPATPAATTPGAGTPGATTPDAGTQPAANSGVGPAGNALGPAAGPGQSTQPTAGAGGITPGSMQSQPQALGGTVIGGNIVGVGGKSKQSSLLVYQGGDTYEEWEFIYNPVQQAGTPQGVTPGQQAPASPTTAPGQQPPVGISPAQFPPEGQAPPQN